MKFLLDTNLLIDLRNNQNGQTNFYISDITIYELMKHKSNKEKEEIFDNLINLVIKTRMNICSIDERFTKVLGLPYYKIRKRINDMCISVFKTMFKNYTNFVTAVIEMIYLKLNNITISGENFVTENNETKIQVAWFLTIVSKSNTHFINRYLHEFCKYTYKAKENFSHIQFEKTLTDIVINNFKKYLNVEYETMKSPDNFNYVDLIKNNNLKFTREEIEYMLSKLINIEKNKDVSYTVYAAYLCEVLIRGGKLEYNDMIDMNLISNAYTSQMIFLTKESKIKRVMEELQLGFFAVVGVLCFVAIWLIFYLH